MKRLHTIFSGAVLIASGFMAVILPESRLCFIIAAAAAVLQVFFIPLHSRSPGISAAGLAAALVCFAAAAASHFSHSVIPCVICACALLLCAVLLIAAPRRKRIAAEDEDALRFPVLLTEMMDTISRATAERSCGIYTQLLYEYARFCEPCEDVCVRRLEREILTAITAIRPDDTDEEISKKCTAILEQLKKRDKAMTKQNGF